jgi:hypothetical protein
MSFPALQDRHPRLALPFALMGLAGGVLTAQLTANGSMEHTLRWLLILITPAVSAQLGVTLSRRIRNGWILRTILSVIVAGLVNGILIGMFVGAFVGVIIGGAFGLFFSLPFIPAMALVTAWSRPVGRARHRSLVDGADARTVWAATAVAIGCGSLFALIGRHQTGTGWALCALACVTVVVALLAIDAAALQHLSRAEADLARMRPVQPGTPLPAAPLTDLGVGETVSVEIAVAATPYREADRPVQVIVGDAPAARDALTRAVRRDVIALALTVSALATHLWWGHALYR